MERHFDFENKEIYFQTDDYGIVVIKDILSSRRDGIGRTFMAYYAYGNKCFVDDIEKCHRIAFGTIFITQGEFPCYDIYPPRLTNV